MLKRNKLNPILKPQTNLSWSSEKVYNCAVNKDNGVYSMIFRAVGDDWISRLGLGVSSDGIEFTVNSSPVMSPLHSWEVKGCEDPRIVKFDDTYYITYTAFDGLTARSAIAKSSDLYNWQDRQLLFPYSNLVQREDLPANWSKAAAIYPKKINHKYYLLFGDHHIWAAVSSNLIDWEILPDSVLSYRDGHFDSAYVEMGPPPILTSRGWLVLYHGIDRFNSQRVYSLGAALFEKDNPLKLLWRSNSPILTPTESYEILGKIDIVDGGFETLRTIQISDLQQLAAENRLPKAVFCCGAILEDELIRLYYGGSDTVICTATVDLETILNA
jgi:beta-1,2-mannobiose phosphorylase / 1,2-beta-oligomannan phosphorylase